MKRTWRFSVALTALFLIVPPVTVSAGTALNWSGTTHGSARDLNGPNIWGNSGLFFHDGNPHTLLSAGNGDGPHGFAGISGNAGFGVLHAAASGSAFVTGDAGGGLLVEFGDAITIVAPGLAPGTPVNLMFSTSLHDALYATYPNEVGYAATAIAYFRAGNQSATIEDSLFSPATSHFASFAYAAHVGDQVDIRGYLSVGAAAFIPRALWADSAAASAFSDASNTALFQIDSLTPGASFVSDSGASYAAQTEAAVPEPGSLLIFAAGFAGLFAARWRRRRRSDPGEVAPNTRRANYFSNLRPIQLGTRA